jgi:hypothetical protein
VREKALRFCTSAAGALTAYSLVAYLYFGLRIALEPGRQYVGPVDDPQIPIWSFAWWPHAILHGHNPFVTPALWAPVGVNLTWTNANPGPALLFYPVTLLAGPVAAYNAAAILMPALAAWTGFLLCRHLTRSWWPSFAGGYLFGFSSYMLGQQAGHLQLTAIFIVPLIALVVVRYLQGELDRRGLVVRLTPLLALQVLFSLELAFTITLALAAGLLCAALIPRARPRLLGSLPPIVVSYALAGLLTAPFIYYALTGFKIAGFIPTQGFRDDLLNLAIPTRLILAGGSVLHGVSRNFTGGDPVEADAYLGLPVLLMIALYAWRRWRTPTGRFLLVALAVTVVSSLGRELTVNGHSLLPIPTVFGHQAMTLPVIGLTHLPLFDNTLPNRFSLYVSLVAAVIVALWAASRPRGSVARWLLPGLAILALVPDVASSHWVTTYSVPRFFTASEYRSCIAPNAIVLPQPVGGGGDSMLWQVAGGFRFRMAGGRVATTPPTEFMHPATIAQVSVGYPPVADQSQLLRAYIGMAGVSDVIVDKSQSSVWSPALDRIARAQDVGGVLLYRVGAAAARCPAGAR